MRQSGPLAKAYDGEHAGAEVEAVMRWSCVPETAARRSPQWWAERHLGP
jgi:hypothetical protein